MTDRIDRLPAPIALALLLSLGGCAASDRPAETRVAPARDSGPRLVDVTDSHVPVAPDLHALDIALADVDGDGDLDAAIAVEGGTNRLYLNDGSGRFSWAEGAFGTRAADNEHVRTADFDRDGHADFVFVAEDDRVIQLFLGRGDGSFVDACDRLPVQAEANGLAVGDVNSDGLPDIVIGTSGVRGKHGDGQNFLWLGDPKRPGWFVDATDRLPQLRDDTQGVALADLDGDGALDIVVANERPPNLLLYNDGTGRFTARPDRLGLAVPLETREAHVFDASGDGRADILFLNLTSNAGGWDKDPQSRLLIQQADGRFVDETATRLPAHRFSSWGGAVVDLDRDGHPDLIVGAIDVPGFRAGQLQAWRNDGSGRFVDRTAEWVPTSAVGRHWSMAVGDVDGDGIADLFVGGWGTQLRLLLGR